MTIRRYLQYRLVCYFPIIWKLSPGGRKGVGPYEVRWGWIDRLLWWLGEGRGYQGETTQIFHWNRGTVAADPQPPPLTLEKIKELKEILDREE